MQTEPLRLKPAERAKKPTSAFGNRLGAQERLQLVVDTAAKRFERDGYHGTSLQNIADDVGITKAALYHYVDSKDQLLYLIHDAFISTMIESAEGFLALDKGPEDQISFYIRDIFETISNYRPYVKAFYRDYGALSGEFQTQVRKKRESYERLVEETVKAGIKSGVFAPTLNPRHATLFLFGACNSAFQWLSHGEAVEAISREWTDLILNSFRRS